MKVYHFHVLNTIYDVMAPDAGSAMQYMNRNVIDGLNLHPMAWMDMPNLPDSYYCQPGDFFN